MIKLTYKTRETMNTIIHTAHQFVDGIDEILLGDIKAIIFLKLDTVSLTFCLYVSKDWHKIIHLLPLARSLKYGFATKKDLCEHSLIKDWPRHNKDIIKYMSFEELKRISLNEENDDISKVCQYRPLEDLIALKILKIGANNYGLFLNKDNIRIFDYLLGKKMTNAATIKCFIMSDINGGAESKALFLLAVHYSLAGKSFEEDLSRFNYNFYYPILIDHYSLNKANAKKDKVFDFTKHNAYGHMILLLIEDGFTITYSNLLNIYIEDKEKIKQLFIICFDKGFITQDELKDLNGLLG